MVRMGAKPEQRRINAAQGGSPHIQTGSQRGFGEGVEWVGMPTKPLSVEEMLLQHGINENNAEHVWEDIEYLETQKQVIQTILYDDSVLALLWYGGVRGGKTLGGCKTTIAVNDHFPGASTLIARDTRVNLEATTLDTFFGVDTFGQSVIPPMWYLEEEYNRTKGVIQDKNGGKICMWGLDSKQNIDRVKSSQWSFLWLEEVTGIAFPIVKFLLNTRLSHPVGPRKALLTTNTDRGEDEVYKLFFEDHTCDPEKFCKECDGRCSFRRIYSSTRENYRNLPQKYVERSEALARTDPRYHGIFMEGKWANISGSIFPEFSERIHILDFPAGYEWADEIAETVYGYDHGWGGAPSCMLEAKVLHDGTIIFWDEYYTDPQDRPDVGSISRDLIDLKITYIHFPDPSIRAKNQYKDKGSNLCSVQDLFQEHGITMDVDNTNNDVSGGIEKMKTMLIPQREHLCPVPGIAKEGLPDQPFIYLARVGGHLRCPNLNRQFKKYKNRENLRGEQNPNKWDPMPIDDHALDPARYIVNGRPRRPKTEAEEPSQSSSGWAKKLQLKKESLDHGDGWEEMSDGFRSL